MQFMEFKAFLANAECFANQFTFPLPTLDQLPGKSFSHHIPISRAASLFEMKDS